MRIPQVHFLMLFFSFFSFPMLSASDEIIEKQDQEAIKCSTTQEIKNQEEIVNHIVLFLNKQQYKDAFSLLQKYQNTPLLSLKDYTLILEHTLVEGERWERILRSFLLYGIGGIAMPAALVANCSNAYGKPARTIMLLAIFASLPLLPFITQQSDFLELISTLVREKREELSKSSLPHIVSES